MAIGTRSYTRGYLSSSGIPPGIRALLISTVAIFIIYFFASRGLRATFDVYSAAAELDRALGRPIPLLGNNP